MPGDRPHRYRSASVLTHPLTPGYFFLRPQLLKRT